MLGFINGTIPRWLQKKHFSGSLNPFKVNFLLTCWFSIQEVKENESQKKIVHVTSNEDYFKSLNFLGKIASCHRIAVIIVTLNAISPRNFRLLDSYSVVEKSCLVC